MAEVINYMEPVSLDEIKKYGQDHGMQHHHFYELSVEMAERMAVHADGIFPKKLLEERRPNEPMEVKEYREKIWVAITKPVFAKVFSSLQKIRRSQDWMIKYEGLDQFTRIAESETLEQYCEYDYPFFTSLTNWVFALLLRSYLIDANALIAVVPLNPEAEANEYIKPFPIIYPSCEVLEFGEGSFALVRNPMGAKYEERGKNIDGCSYYFFTTQFIYRYDQVNSHGDYAITYSYEHSLGVLPVFKMPGVLLKQSEFTFLQETRVAGMLPELDEAVREYSDLQAARVLHIYPERWEFSQNECPTCKGLGVVRNPAYDPAIKNGCSPELACTTCEGRAYVVAGPFSKMIVHPTGNVEGQQIPTPPAGFIEKDSGVVDMQEKSVEKHLYNALAAINFEFLASTPLAQSGVAKEVDRDELNNTVNSIAEDLVYVMDKVYELTALYRYGRLYSPEDISEMLPKVNVPESYDLLSAARTVEEMKLARDGKANPVIINAMEIDYAAKRFSTAPEVRDHLMLVLALDPLPNISEEDKVSRLTNKGITLETYIVSSNIQEFVAKAMDGVPGFEAMDLQAQKEVIAGFARGQIAATSTTKLIVDATMGGLEEQQ